MDNATLQRLLALYPFEDLGTDDKGNARFMTCPVRITFSYLAKPREKKSGLKYECAMIVPPGVDCSIAARAIEAAANASPQKASWRNDAAMNRYFLPIKSQARLAEKYDGFSSDPGAVFFQGSTNFCPPICRFDAAGNKIPMTYEPGGGFYNGIWARVGLSTYTYFPNAKNRESTAGVGFNLIALQKLADDVEFRGEDSTSIFTHKAGAPAVAAASPMMPVAPAGLPGMTAGVPYPTAAVPAVPQAQSYAPAPAASPFSLPGLG